MGNKPITLPRPIRKILGYNLRPINGGLRWGMYAGKKIKFEAPTIKECEEWAKVSYEIKDEEARLEKIKKFNATVKPTKQVYVRNIEKKIRVRKEKLNQTKTPK